MNDSVLTQLRARLRRWTALRVTLTLAGLLGALALAAVLLDVALDLSETARLAAPWLLAFCTLVVLGRAWARSRSLSEYRAARLFERAGLAPGNRMSNAVQLAGQSSNSPVGEFLRAESIELGRQSAAQLQTWPVVRPAIKLAGAAAVSVLILWLGLILIAPEMLHAVSPRFMDPRGDHPPFSRLKIEVAPGRASVLYGGQLEIKASTSGRPADKLWLVARSGANTSRTMMFLAPDKSFFQTLANIRESAEYFVTDGHARSRKFPIEVRYTPQITLVEVTTTFPEYTAKPPHTAKLSDEPQALPEGTKISYRVVSNRPLKSGALELTPVLGGKPTRVQLTPDGQSNVVSGAFTLAAPTLFTVSVSDVDGLTSADPRKGRFNISPDERPRLFVLEPGRDAVATPTINIPVRVQASDDYGVTRVVWLRGHNRSIERAFSMKLELKSGPQAVEAAGSFDLSKLGVRPGDVIDYYFEAADNYPQGPNVTLSRFYRLQIISEEQYRDYLRQAAARKALFEPYFQMDSWLQRLAERARQLEARAASPSEAEQKAATEDAQKLADDLEKFEEKLGGLLGEAMMFDVEKSFRESLVAEHTGVGEARKQLRAAGSGSSGSSKIGEAAKKLSELAKAGQQDVAEPAQQIASVARLLAKADTFVKLAHQEAAVAQLLRRYTENTAGLSRLEQMEVQELAHQQRLIQDGLRKYLSSLDDAVADLPADESFDPLRRDVTNFVAAVTEAKIEEDVGQASSFLGNLDAPSGYAASQSAATKMDKLIAKCQSMADPEKAGQCMRFQPKISQSMGNTLQQILDAMGSGRNPGSGRGGQRGQGGYSLFNNDVGLYGPSSELAGEQAGGRGDAGRSGGRPSERFTGDPGDPTRPGPRAPGRVKLQTDAKFPLRYRDLVGEYFRAIAESQMEEPK